MPDCNVSGQLNVSNEVNEVLNEITGTVKVFGPDSDKIAIASLLNEIGFKRGLRDLIAKDTNLLDKLISLGIDYNSITKIKADDYRKLINQIIQTNQVKGYIRDTYLERHPAVSNTSVKSNINGFDTGVIRQLAYREVANTLLIKHIENKNRENKRSKDEIISSVTAEVLDRFFNSVVDHAIANNKTFISGRQKDNLLKKRYINLSAEGKDLQSKLSSLEEKRLELLDEYDEIPEEATDRTKKQNVRYTEIQNELRQIKKVSEETKTKLNSIVLDKAIAGIALMKEVYTTKSVYDTRYRNYANLVDQLLRNPGEFIRDSLSIGGFQDLLKEYTNNIDELMDYEEYDDKNILVDEESFKIDDSRDTSTKNWNDALPKDFNELVKTNNKLYLSTIPKLTRDGKYDTNNELGINEFLDYHTVINNIIANVSTASPEAFLDTLQRLSQRVPELAGLQKIIEDCENDYGLLYRLFTQFDYEIYNKLKIDIGNNSVVRLSNPKTRTLTHNFYTLSNQVRFTKYHAYSTSDVNDLSAIANINRRVTLNDNSRVFYTNKIKQVFRRVFNNFDETIIDNFIEDRTVNDVDRQLQKLAASTIQLLNSIKNYNDKYLDLVKEQRQRIQEEKEEKINNIETIASLMKESDAEQESRARFELDETALNNENDKINTAIYRICQMINNYGLAKNEYTSVGVKGNRASDIIKNSYISRLNDIMRYEEKKNEALGIAFDNPNRGLDILYDKVGKGERTSNQFAFHPVIYGVEIGGIKVPGIFDLSKGSIGYSPNAKLLLESELFEGVDAGNKFRNVDYVGMSGNDYFITRFLMFFRPRTIITEKGRQRGIKGNDFANYFLRVPSDATHNYTMRYLKLRNEQVEASVASHLKQELCNFITNLNNVFEFNKTTNRWELTKDVDKLFTYAHCEREDGQVILERDGELVGNFFNFRKFFNVNGKDYSRLIKDAFSLYGANGLIKNDNGVLYIDITSDAYKQLVRTSENSGTTKIRFKDTRQFDDLFLRIAKEWTGEYLNDAKVLLKNEIDRLREVDGYYAEGSEITDGIFTDKDIENFLLNDVNMNMNFDELIEGNTGYYKDSQTFLKRTKQNQAGGASFNVGGIGMEFEPLATIKLKGKDLTVVSSDGKTQFKASDGRNLEIRNGFKAVTIKNSIRGSKRYDSLHKEMVDIFTRQLKRQNETRENKLTDEEIHKRAIKYASASVQSFYGRAEERKGTTVNDAQSYITLDEFIRRTYIDGSFQEYEPLFMKLKQLEQDIKDGKDINLDDYDLDAINAKIQVQKNFYYDQMYDDVTENYYSRQIKNAEFVLIKGLLGEGSELDKLYDIMVEHGIDQINTDETSKASNKETLVYWDDNGVVNENFASGIDKNAEVYYYRYLYKQQDNPEHMKNMSNKFGLQAQVKIPDNLDFTNPYMRAQLNNYFGAYSTKIHNSYLDLLDNMGYKLNNEGKVVNKSDGSEDLNVEEFYKRAMEEAVRLGVNSQFMEFLMPYNSDGTPKMDNSMNLVSNKIENIFQALYNSSITRQKIPGWHAVQVTSVGTSKELQFHPEGYYNEKEHKYVTIEEYENLENKDGYEKTNLPYVEIRIPRWSKDIPKDIPEKELIRLLEEAGLDKQLIYRIPTEGKQSIAIAKVVGFIDDVYGSTVLLPDEWVTKTGADFDTDSVYSMYHHLRYDKKKGKFVKEKYFELDKNLSESERERAIELQYRKYIKSKLKERVEKQKITSSDRDKAWKEAYDKISGAERREELRKQFEDLQNEEEEVWQYIPKDVKNKIIEYHEDIKKSKVTELAYFEYSYGEGKGSEYSPGEKYINQLIGTNKILSESLNDENLSKQEKQDIQDLIDINEDIIDNVTEQGERFDLEDVKREYESTIDELKAEYKLLNKEEFERVAAEAGLPSLEEFKKFPVERMNTREGLDNNIIDSLINIMADPSSREEDYATSNFIDISEAMEIIGNRELGRNKMLNTPYDTNSQIRNFVNAMSGTKLKGMSVNLDTFLSKCNIGRVELGGDFAGSIRVKYDMTRKDNEGNPIYDFDDIVEAFGETNVEGKKGDKFIIVTHNRMGWSNNNKNVVGKIISMYSSETTAHTLDAMKVGSAYNVNDFTFKAYKIMPMLGIDYYTAMAFIYQPGISRLNVEHDRINSVYIKQSGNEIRNATKRIIKEIYHDVDEVQKMHGYFELIEYASSNERTQSILKELLGTNVDKNNSYFDANKIFDISMLLERLNNARDYGNEFDYHFGQDNDKSRTEEAKIRDACIDLIVLSQYSNLSNLGNNINEIARVSKPEKLGAAQTIYETRKTIKRIDDITGRTTIRREKDVRTEAQKEKDIQIKDTLIINKVIDGREIKLDFLSALFPTDADSKTILPEESFYPFIAQMYKDSTMASVEINSKLFRLEDEKFYDIIDTIGIRIGRQLGPDQAKQFKKYAVGYAYNKVPSLVLPVSLDKDGKVVIEGDLNSFELIEAEKKRINGYMTTSASFEVKHLNNPTAEEINKFRKLTPAQKVQFIQKAFRYGAGIFEYLEAESMRADIYNKTGLSGQRIRFNDESLNIETLFEAFNESFNNKNPLIRLAAIDLVKYGLLVEGQNFGVGKVSKFITNDAIYLGIEDHGMDIMSSYLRVLDNDFGQEKVDKEFVEKFIRSHSDMVPTVTIFETESKVMRDGRTRKVTTSEQEGLKKCIKYGEIFVIPNVRDREGTELDSVDNNIAAFLARIEDHPDKYINLSYRYKGTQRNNLYEVIACDDGSYLLIPKSKLNTNEYSQYSFARENYKLYDKKTSEEDRALKPDLPSTIPVAFLPDEYYNEIRQEYIDAVQEHITGEELAARTKETVFEGIAKSVAKAKEGNKRLTGEKIEVKETEVETNKNYLDNIMKLDNKNLTSADRRLKDSIIKLVQDITGGDPRTNKTNEYGIYGTDNPLNKLYVYNPSVELKQLFRPGVTVVQRIRDREGKMLTVAITRKKNFKKRYDKDKRIFKIASQAKVDEGNEQIGKATSTYFVQIVSTTEKPNQKDKLSSLSAIARTNAEDYDQNHTNQFIRPVNRVLDKIRIESAKGDTRASEFLNTLKYQGIDSRLISHLTREQEFVFRNLSTYYRHLVQDYKDQMNEFTLANGETYSIDDPKLYEELGYSDILDQANDYNKLIKLILDARTCKEYLEGLAHTGDLKTDKYIDEILSNVNSLAAHKLDTAFEHLFNIYFAKYSNDPLIRDGIVKLREQFGDLSWLDSWITDVTHIRSKEVQVVTKIINDTLARVERVIAPKAQIEVEKKYDEIIRSEGGDIDFNKIIGKDGNMAKEFTPSFIEERDRLNEELDAISIDPNKGKNSIDYWRKYIEKEKFYAKNIHREAVAKLYQEKVDNIEKALNECGDLFIEYERLRKDLYTSVYNFGTEEENIRRRQVQEQIKALFERQDDETKVQKTDAQIKRIEALERYVNEHNRIQKEYYEYTPEESWQSDLEYYTKIRDRYDAAHTLETHDEKMANPEYAEAWNWIHNNTWVPLGEKAKKAIEESFRALQNGNKRSVSKKVYQLAKDIGAYDSKNQIDGRMFTREQIKQARDWQIENYRNYALSNTGDSTLYKEIPEQPILTNAFWDKFNELHSTTTDKADKKKITGRINEILEPYINKASNEIDTIQLVRDLYEDERNGGSLYKELSSLYRQLHRGGKRQDRKFKEWSKNTVEVKYNMTAYERERAKRITLLNSKELPKRASDMWIDLFVTGKKNGEITPNFDVFGYFEVKDPKYIDTEKTKHRDRIFRNIEFIPNEYYWDAYTQAQAEGRWSEWYDENHVYNQYTGKWEPLRIWTTMRLKDDNEFGESPQYTPTFGNKTKAIKEKYKNKNYKKGTDNYNSELGQHNTGIVLTAKEKRMKDFILETLQSGVANYKMQQAVNKGMFPRLPKSAVWDTRRVMKEILNVAGLTWDRSYLDKDAKTGENYSDDRIDQLDMFEIIKAKGYEKEKIIESQQPWQTDEEYRQYVRKLQKENDNIRKNNLELEEAIRSKDVKKILSEYVKRSELAKGKEAAKNTLYVLLEELRSNQAYMINAKGNVSIDNKGSSRDFAVYRTEGLKNMNATTTNWGLRRIYGDYHEKSLMRSIANDLQQFTSAKFMIGNIWSGITNVTMGYVNMEMERAAGEYFETKDAITAQMEYTHGGLSYIDSLFRTKRTFTNKTDALIHYFNVLEYDRLLERQDTETLDEYSEKIRKLLYLNQSGGEHLMQNTVLLAVLHGTRTYYDEQLGRTVLMSKQQLRYEYEHKALEKVLQKYPEYQQAFNTFRKAVKNNKQELFQYDKRSKDLATEFIKLLYNDAIPGTKISKQLRDDILNAFREERVKSVEEADKKFETLKTVYDQITFKDGIVDIAVQKDKNGDTLYHNGDVGFITEQLIGDISNRVISINKKIHGVYDKDGAAMLERKWYGSLLMQYHKHIWPGIMKHWRNKGYFNEYRMTREKGMYAEVYNYFKNSLTLMDAWQKAEGKKDGFVQNLINSLSALPQIANNLRLNWMLMPSEQRNNLKRIGAEFSGIAVSLLSFMLIYSLYDEDEIHESLIASNAIYLTDRLLSEIIMYNPYGAVQEAQTLWQNPVAGGAFYMDAMKAASLAIEYMIDPDFTGIHDRGPYKGMSKWEVLARRNFWLSRIALRFKTIGANNKYYRIGNKSIVSSLAKEIVYDDDEDDRTYENDYRDE